MSWNSIIAQERIKKILQRAFVENKISSAYLFVGNDGVGKDAVAIEFAMLLNCPDPIINGNSAEISESFQAKYSENIFNHPNISLLTALPVGKSSDKKSSSSIDSLSKDQIDKIQSEISLKAQDPYHRIDIPDARQIRISQIREIKNKLKLSKSVPGRTVVIISNAHLMTTEASNAFLKTIEEPHPNTTIILTTNNLELILQTIRSRCQIIKFPPIPDDELISYLSENGVDESNSRLIIPFANGSISTANDFLDENMNELRNLVLEMLRSSMKKNVYRLELTDLVRSLTSSKEKKLIENAIQILTIWLNDAMKVSLGVNKIVNLDQLDTIKKFVEHFSNGNFSNAIELCQKSIYELKSNVNPNLVLIALFTNLRKEFLK